MDDFATLLGGGGEAGDEGGECFIVPALAERERKNADEFRSSDPVTAMWL